MLTQSDLTKIKEQIREEIKPVNDRLDKVDKRFNRVDTQFNRVDTQFNKVGKQFNKIHKDLKIIINYFDHNSANHETRITKIEQHLSFSKFPSL
jgi:archaellum component FlaC